LQKDLYEENTVNLVLILVYIFSMPVKKFLSLVKFSHTVFALPFALIGFTIALAKCNRLQIDYVLLGKVILCMVFARNAAMAFNRYLDRDIDKENKRTSMREIPSGIISPKAAIIFVIINSVFFIVTTWFINALCFYLSPVALIIILGYSFTKRFTSWCHLVLGLGLSLAPIGSYLAVCGKFSIIPLFISLAVLFWVAGFDVIYSMQDYYFDKERNLHSVPVLLGNFYALRLSEFFHLLTVVFLLLAGFIFGSGIFYLIGLCIFTILLIYQHLIVKPNDLSKVNIAFFTTNGIASIVFGVFVIIDVFWYNGL
jgi:4-hydroxybenzoate polyprenyltransferase